MGQPRLRYVALALLLLDACHGADRPTPTPVAIVERSSEPSDDEESYEEGPTKDDAATPPVGALQGAPADLIAEATRELEHATRVRYQHRTFVDEASGEYDFDCSGFALYALGRVAPRSLEELTEATVRRPLAKHFEAFFEELSANTRTRHWRRVAHVSDLEPGDIIAWIHPDAKTHASGHTMLVRAAPRARDPRTFTVPIIDSTGHSHGDGDARGATNQTGLGTGEIELEVDDGGRPLAFRWGADAHFKRRVVPIAMGRIVK